MKNKTILVPLDGSENSKRALKKAIEIAKPERSKILGLYVVYAPPAFVISKPKINFKENLIHDSQKFLDNAKETCKKNGIDFESKIIHGSDPGFDIVKFSENKKFDMIVVGARGLNPVKKILIGSVSNYVLNNTKIPVLVVK